MLYIEMVGLPGAGKTTICRPLCDKLRENNIRVIDLNHLNFWAGSKIQKVKALFSSLCNIKLWKLFSFYYVIAKKYNYNVLRNRYFWGLILLTNQVFRVIKKGKYDVILFDEGIVQFITSIVHDKCFDNDYQIIDLVELLKKNQLNPLLIDCCISTTTSLKRIRNRGKNKAVRFAKIYDDDKLLELLKIKKQNIDIIKRKFELLKKIDMNDDINYNVNILYNEIIKN